MKTLLCYGDSNTHGYDPLTGGRYPSDVRWPGVLAKLLGQDWHVIEEGLNGRTTVFRDPLEPWKSGRDYLRPCLNSHKPVDQVILMLGSNDLKACFHASPEEIAKGAAELLGIIRDFCLEKQGFSPKVLLVSPPWLGPGILNSPFAHNFDDTAVGRSKQLAALYEAAAAEYGCAFFDAASCIVASEADSLHLMPDMHRLLAERIFDILKAGKG